MVPFPTGSARAVDKNRAALGFEHSELTRPIRESAVRRELVTEAIKPTKQNPMLGACL